MSTMTITQNAHGTFDATVQLQNGFTESIEDLYDYESALEWCNMHLNFSAGTNRYLRY